MTYEAIILKYLESLRKNDPNGGWIREYTIRCKDTPWGWIGARGDRTVRDMIKEGRIEAGYEGKYRIVRAKQNFIDEFIAQNPPRTAKVQGFQHIGKTLGI